MDALGSPGYVAREVIGEEEVVDFTQRPDLMERLADRFAVAVSRYVGDLVSARGQLRLP